MISVNCCLFIFLIFLLCVNAAVVPLNELCPLSDDVESIIHEPNQHIVKIKYKPTRRCDRPSLVLRISGTALTVLREHDFKNDTQTYWYPALIDPGEYFLEVVVIFCLKFDLSKQARPCVEPAHYGRNILTRQYSFQVQSTAQAQVNVRPRWVNRAPPKLLVTRHQYLVSEPLGLRTCASRYGGRYCASDHVEIEPYLAYKWVDGPDWQADSRAVYAQLTTPATAAESTTTPPISTTVAPTPATGAESIVRTPTTPVINICYVGDSHSRNLYFQAKRIVDPITPHITATYIFSLFQPLFNVSSLAENHCSVAVLSYGIWSLSHSPVGHTPRMHSAQTSALIRKLVAYRGPTRLFVRSENHNGLGSEVIACPGRDRRSPPAFDMVNRITREICERRKVPFIDLDPIIYPMWDAAYDYCHPPGHVFQAEVAYILHKVFKHLLHHQQGVTTFPAAVVVQNITDVPSYAAQDAQVALMKEWLKEHGNDVDPES